MANTYDYEGNPQLGDMPYDQAEQAAEVATCRCCGLRIHRSPTGEWVTSSSACRASGRRFGPHAPDEIGFGLVTDRPPSWMDWEI